MDTTLCLRLWLLLVLVVAPGLPGCGGDRPNVPKRYVANVDPTEAIDEAMGGRTVRGTPVTPRTEECFPAEPRDLFWEMDQVADANGTLRPLNFDEDGNGVVDDTERKAIRGRNTWLMWGGGNEAFWGWLQEEGYGIADLLILLDSRGRDPKSGPPGTPYAEGRFARTGLINQPGFAPSSEKFLGLYLDRPASPGSAILRPPPGPDVDDDRCPPSSSAYGDAEPERYDAQGRCLSPAVERPVLPAMHAKELFVPWTTSAERDAAWKKTKQQGPDPFRDYVPERVREWLAQDGLDPSVYGYPSGIFGLRLHLNPDFFAKTDAAEQARLYWKERVEGNGDRYYTDASIHADPKLIRPFRVSMSCGFCHIGPHPLNPPADVENPGFANLSGVIGGQYWDPQPAFANLAPPTNFLHHFLRSQAPGTVDTSLVSTDHINNTNVINAVFDVPARLERAKKKPTELQSADNRLLPSLEDAGDPPRRHFPMVLFPGEDSVGVFGALARVYLNIGVFSEQWARSDNPVIGFTPQHAFRVRTNRTNSVYWRVNETYRVPYLASFFTLGTKGHVPKSTAAMLLQHAGPRGPAALARDESWKRQRGRDVFIDNCAICHSSKQPDGFDLRFKRTIAQGWEHAPVPSDPKRRRYTLPMDYADWETFKKSPAYQDYVAALRAEPYVAAPYDGQAATRDEFLEDNFLSNELRVPVTLVGTYSGRAMATNAMRGQVWDNFSSETFKNLRSVGKVRFFNPYPADPAGLRPDPHFDTNDEYDDGRERGGPGYYRPASLISLWATAPYFHNNALGTYTHDPSVRGRLRAFHDGMRKLLWKTDRSNYRGKPHPGDLRAEGSRAAAKDPGYIYRLPVDTEFRFAPGFTRPLLDGVLSRRLSPTASRILLAIAGLWLWVALFLLFASAARWWGRARHVGALLLVLAVVLAVALAVTGAGGFGGTLPGAMMMLVAATPMAWPPLWLWGVAVVLGVAGFVLLLTRWEGRGLARVAFGLLALVVVLTGYRAHEALAGRGKGIAIGPIPRGVPVNLLMNIDPEKTDRLPAAIVGLLRAMAQIKQEGRSREDAHDVFATVAGPALIAASKCPDMVLDRGHWFGEFLGNDDKDALMAYLKTF